MYVMNKKHDSIINISQCVSIYVGQDFDIKAIPANGDGFYRLGAYETDMIARAVLNDLFAHVPTSTFYQMPDNKRALILARGMSDDNPEKFAANGKKTVRRGGS